jgi:Cu/Ag efflux protein CusF
MPTFRSASLSIALLACALAGPALAQHEHHGQGANPGAAAPATPALPPTQAEVRRVDAASGKLTLQHGPIQNLDMPPMTMVFAVKERQWLDGLKPGDRLVVTVDKVNGQYTVLSLRPDAAR